MNHATLLARLQSEFRVTDTPLSWIESYLSDKSFPCQPIVGTCNSGQLRYSTRVCSWIGRLINSSAITDMPMIHNFTPPRQTTQKRPKMPRVLHCGPATLVLRERPSPEPRQIGGLFLRYETEVVKNAATTNCNSCRLPHYDVGQTKDTRCNIK